MDPLSVTTIIVAVIQFSFNVYVLRPADYVKFYGVYGVLLIVFGARNVWDIQAEVLGSRNDETAMAFKKTVQDESTTCAVAVIWAPQFQREQLKNVIRLLLCHKLLSQHCRFHFSAKHIG